jgi:hypothetical protein
MSVSRGESTCLRATPMVFDRGADSRRGPAFWCCAVLRYFAPKGPNKKAQGNALGTRKGRNTGVAMFRPCRARNPTSPRFLGRCPRLVCRCPFGATENSATPKRAREGAKPNTVELALPCQRKRFWFSFPPARVGMPYSTLPRRWDRNGEVKLRERGAFKTTVLNRKRGNKSIASLLR